MKGVAFRVLGKCRFCVIHSGNQILRRIQTAAFRCFKLRIDGSEVTRRSHQNVMRTHRQQGSSALGLIRDDHGQLPTARLGLADQSDCGLPIATRRIQQQMQILSRICIGNHLLEQRDDRRKDCINDYNQPAVEARFVLFDELLSVIALRVLGVEKWALLWPL